MNKDDSENIPEVEMISDEFKKGFMAAILSVIKILEDNRQMERDKLIKLFNTTFNEVKKS
jgi:hypothetical protein